MKFTVTNPDGSEPDFAKITYEEDWAWFFTKDKPKFALVQDGELIVISRGMISRCPPGRFTVHMGEDK